MKITIEIPDEFKKDFLSDRFRDFCGRVKVDMHCLCGLYEKETIDMLENAFHNAEIHESEPCIVTKTTSNYSEQKTEIVLKGASEAESIDFLKKRLLDAIQDPDIDGVLEYNICDINKETLIVDGDVNLLNEIEKDASLMLYFMRSPSGLASEFYQILKI